MSGFTLGLAAALPALGGWLRRSWCRKQRRRLVGMTAAVLWVPADMVPWALWGAEHRFFDAGWAGRLLYLTTR